MPYEVICSILHLSLGSLNRWRVREDLESDRRAHVRRIENG
jgi:hypothetical protein